MALSELLGEKMTLQKMSEALYWKMYNKLVEIVSDINLAESYTAVSGGEWSSSIKAGLKDGGTAHTWRNSAAPIKQHINLYEL